jgi:hypothetical protein
LRGAGRKNGRARIPRTVVALGVVSLLNDLAGDAVTPLLLALVAAAGGEPEALGVIEGVADAAESLIQIVSGYPADRTGKLINPFEEYLHFEKSGIVLFLISAELGEDPADLVANLVLHSTHTVIQFRVWTSAFLLLHGIVKLLLVAGLISNKSGHIRQRSWRLQDSRSIRFSNWFINCPRSWKTSSYWTAFRVVGYYRISTSEAGE